MKKTVYGVVLVLIFVPTLLQLLDQLLHLANLYATPGALLGQLSGTGWLGRKILLVLTTLGFPPHGAGSATGPFHAGNGIHVLLLNALAVVLAARRLFLSPPWGANIPAPTFEKPQLILAWVALSALVLAIVQQTLSPPLLPELGRAIEQISFRRVHGLRHLGAILLAFTFWWTEIRTLARGLSQAG